MLAGDLMHVIQMAHQAWFVLTPLAPGAGFGDPPQQSQGFLSQGLFDADAGHLDGRLRHSGRRFEQ